MFNHGPQLNRALQQHGTTYHINRPATSVVDALSALAQLAHPPTLGLKPTPGTIHTAHFFANSRDPLFPVSYSTNIDLLACYTAQLADGRLQVLILAGLFCEKGAVGEILRSEAQKLRQYSEGRGPVLKHNLAIVETPGSQLNACKAQRFTQNVVHIPTVFKQLFERRDGGQPALTISPIRLTGWNEGSSLLPHCTFSSTHNGEQIQLAISWGKASRNNVCINLTEPLNTFVPILR
jgi:hypothetical protein